MNTKIISLFVLSMAFMLGIMSFASAVVTIESLAGNKSTVAHGDSFDVSFTIKNTNADTAKNLVNIELKLPTLSFGSWRTAQLGSKTLEIKQDNSVSLTNVKVSPGTSSELIKLTFSTNKYSPANIYANQITFTAKYEDTNANAPIDAIPLEITIPASSTLSLTQSNALSLKQNLSSIVLNNTGNIRLENIALNITGSLTLTSSQNEIAFLDAGKASIPIEIKADLSKLVFGSNTATITARAKDNTSASSTYSLTKTFCSAGQVSTNLSIKNFEITEFNKDDDIWKLMDSVTIELEIKSNVAENIEDVVIEMGLFNEFGENMADELVFTDDEGDKERIKIGDINDGDSEIAVFKFRVPADLKIGNYKLTAKGYSDKEGEEKTCTDVSGDFGNNNFFMPIKIEREDDDGKAIVFDNIKLSPSESTCGDNIEIVFDIFNIGDRDEDQIKLNILNKELRLDLSQEIKKDIKKGDKVRQVKFNFDIPQNVQNKLFNLELTADYNYNKNNEVYKISSDESTIVPLKVIGCQASPISSAKKSEILVSPLASSPKAGSEVTISATIKNLGNAQSTFVTGAKNYESWATLKSSTDRILVLQSGEGKEVKFTFDIKSDAKGEQTFSIESVSDGKTDMQPVKVVLADENSSGFSGLNLGGNTLIWVVGIMNVILLVLIIVVAIRLSRR